MEENLLNALNEIYELTKNTYSTISKRKILEKHKVNNISHKDLAMSELKIYDTKGKKTLWIGEKPNNKLVEKIIEKTKDISKEYKEKLRKNEKCITTPKQYKKEFKIFGFTIYSTITTEL